MSNVVCFPLTGHVAIEAGARDLHHRTRHVPDQRVPRIARQCCMHLQEAVSHGIPEPAARDHAHRLAARLGELMVEFDQEQERHAATG